MRRPELIAPRPRTSAQSAVYAFIDVETTGVDPRHDRVVEVAVLVVREAVTRTSFSSLVQPERAIPATASAVHHLTDADVASAPNITALRPKLLELCSDAVIVAHNASFDLGFLPFLRQRPVICAMRFAKLMVADAPNYKNQVLRYHLGIDDRWLAGSAAHRALGDVALTSRVFAICLERYLAERGSDDLSDDVRFTARLELRRRANRRMKDDVDRLVHAKARPLLVEDAVRTALRDTIAWRIGGGAAPHADAFIAAAVVSARQTLDARGADAAERSRSLNLVQQAANVLSHRP